MTVHDALRVRKFLKHRPVDETLAVALRRGRVYGRRVGDPVGDEVGAGFDERGRAGVVGGNQVLGFVHRVADGDVAEGIDEALLVQDVVCADDEAEGLEEGGGDGGRHFVDGVCVFCAEGRWILLIFDAIATRVFIGSCVGWYFTRRGIWLSWSRRDRKTIIIISPEII